MKISAAFPPVPDTPSHIALAERLGYETAFVYDTPALQLDVWMTLALAAERTDRIVLGPGVLIPSLRHPMVTAAAIATLVGLVGEDRVIVGAGTGFTGRRAMGQKPLKWAEFPKMVADVQALLGGEVVTVDGAAAQMLHWEGQAVDRPIEVPWVLGVNGPRGIGAAKAMECGVITSRPRPDVDYSGIAEVMMLTFGTILEPGESIDSPRVLKAAGPGVVGGDNALLAQPDVGLSALPHAAVPAAQRHLHLHSGHLTELNPIDREVLAPETLSSALVCTADELPERLDVLARTGVTEIVFQPIGDVARELTALASAAGLG